MSSRWLTVLRVNPFEFGTSVEDLRLRLEAQDIESRPAWKPMHLQPLYASCRRVGGGVAERLFQEGLCLPSGSQMTESERARVVEVIERAARRSSRERGAVTGSIPPRTAGAGAKDDSSLRPRRTGSLPDRAS
jgi:dTDP-4-amino-4,6-dideoxygalactose transaminase